MAPAWSTSVRATCISTTGSSKKKLKNKLIYHFGTGTHHVIGIEQATNKSGNAVFAITASKEEYEAYVDLVDHQGAGQQELSRLFRRHLSDAIRSCCPSSMSSPCSTSASSSSRTRRARPTAGWTTPSCSTCSRRRPSRAAISCSTQGSIGLPEGGADHREMGEEGPGQARRRVQDAAGVSRRRNSGGVQ